LTQNQFDQGEEDETTVANPREQTLQ
jgi:hypothetical protein